MIGRTLALALVFLILAASVFPLPPKAKEVTVLDIDGAIGPIAVKMIKKAIKVAEDSGSEALVIRLNTPGGLTNSTWKITTAILSADVPVIVYVWPPGARAGSAGVFITYSAHIAAMSSGTNIGAATPIQMEGEMDSTLAKKVTNDAVANLQSIAEKRGRNQEWIERAIRDGESITASAALDSNVVDLLAEDISELLFKVDGMEVALHSGDTVTLSTKAAVTVKVEKSFSERILEVISDPNIAFILFTLGSLGLVMELYNPGAIVPGVVGGICIILAFFSFQTLPINYSGIALIIFAIILFLLEIKVPSYGILSIGGVVSLALGGLFLIDSPGPYMEVSKGVIVSVVAVTAAFFLIAIRYIFKAHRMQVTTGGEGLIGQSAEVKERIDAEGLVYVSGALWKAVSDEPLEVGTKVEVVSVDGLIVKVKRKA
ncbi:MAG: nodulation protein NfeD [Candidatus Zixiibacteriota bacterium]